MAQAIAIPSPSAFLRNSPTPEDDIELGKPSGPKHARRSSSEERKKKASRKATGVDINFVKPKQSKSRNGCATCKAKRLKCGEERPGCQQCMRRNVECGGYKKDFKWRPFEDSNVKINIDKQKRDTSPKQAAESSKPTTPIQNIATKAVDVERKHADEQNNKRDSIIPYNTTTLMSSLPQRPAPPKRKKSSPSKAKASVIPEDEELNDTPPSLIPDAATPSIYTPTTSIGPEYLHPGSLSHLTPGLGLSPTLTEILLPFNVDDPVHQDFVNFDLPEGFQVPLHLDPSIDPTLDDGLLEDGEIDEDLTNVGPMRQQAMLSPSRQHTPASSNTASDLFDDTPVGYFYPQPHFAEDSREMLTFRFDRLTCGILSVIDGPNENPWRCLIWPLAQQSPALYHAITAMTAFHSATDVPRLRVVGHEHKAASIRYIQEGIRDNSFSLQVAIATALALGFAECWDQHTATGNTHIKGAQVLVRRALEDHRQKPWTGIDLQRLKFLCNAWVYMDVIARLTCVDCDDSNDFDNAFIFSSEGPRMVTGHMQPGFGIDFGMPIDARLDPLMGCAITLFPLIGRVANLVRKVCRSQVNSPSIISQANDLKIALEDWDAPAFIERPEDPTTDVQHTLQTAEAYRWATLLHLHASVPELPSLTTTELAQRTLQYIATVPLTSRTVIVQIYPLMVAGCEAKTAEDRQWVRGRWDAMYARMRIGIVEKCVTVTEEVWRRRDVYEAQPSTNRRLVATADLQPSPRQRGQPLVRSPTGNMRPGDPGRTGVVFSYVEDDDDGNNSDEDDHKKRARDRRNGRDPRMGIMDPAYTVRGHLHWIGVMWDWGWEILLG